ncbi:MAG: hypothetical protein OHK0040_12360 [bacterium]
MRRLFLFFLLIFSTNCFAEELFVNYLKPTDKSDTVIKRNGRSDPMEEPLLISPKLKLKEESLLSSNFKLKAILYNPVSKKAFINNELYLEGDTVDGFKIKSITTDMVILTKNSKDYILKIE